MKKSILLFFTIALNFILIAQSYVPFPTTNAYWQENRWDALGGAFCEDIQVDILGDTLISSTTYHILRESRVTKNFDAGCVDSTSRFNQRIIGYFRNDIPNKKVWIRLPNASEETLLYDFDLKVGDTLPNTLFHKAGLDSSLGIVVNVDTVNYGGIDRKRFLIDGFNPIDIYLIEGIGNTKGFTDDFYPYGIGSGRSLLCLRENDVTVYPDASTSCNFIVDIDDISSFKEAKRIYPNPTHDIIRISNIKGVKEIELMDIQGKLIQLLDVKSQEWKLPEQEGIYIVRIKLKDGEEISQKVLKL